MSRKKATHNMGILAPSQGQATYEIVKIIYDMSEREKLVT